MPLVNIIVPVHNGAKTIGACIESLMAQEYPSDRYSITVVENRSVDNTAEVVSSYPVRLLRTTQRGPAAARNLGVQSVESEIVAFTDADCVAEPTWLSRLVAPYANPQVGGVAGQIVAYEHAGRTLVEIFSDKYSPLINFVNSEDQFLPNLYTANASYRRHLLLDVGGFDPDMLTGEDVELSWRVQLQKGVRLVYASDAIIQHRHRADEKSLSRQYWHYGFGEILLDTLFGKQPNYPRDLRFQVKRIAGQALALPRYGVSMLVRQVRRMRGKATDFEVLEPYLWLLIEQSNIRGKLNALYKTRLMKDATQILQSDKEPMIKKLYGKPANHEHDSI